MKKIISALCVAAAGSLPMLADTVLFVHEGSSQHEVSFAQVREIDFSDEGVKFATTEGTMTIADEDFGGIYMVSTEPSPTPPSPAEPDESSIADIDREASSKAVYDLTGRRVSGQRAGIYIVRQGGKTIKMIKR